jgi:hypothetical protein
VAARPVVAAAEDAGHPVSPDWDTVAAAARLLRHASIPLRDMWVRDTWLVQPDEVWPRILWYAAVGPGQTRISYETDDTQYSIRVYGDPERIAAEIGRTVPDPMRCR